MTKSLNDTIVACATPAGYSSIGVIRVSGSRAVEFTTRLFRSEQDIQQFESHRIYYGEMTNHNTGEPIDKVIAAFYLNPHSYTGEDVVEVSCHGNPLIIDRIIGQYISCGARLADRGEFTRRALLNGKIDLLQAEAVLDTVYSPCEEARKLAIAQYEGTLSDTMYSIKSELVDILVLIEANIDFSEEEDVAKVHSEEGLSTTSSQLIDEKLAHALDTVNNILSNAEIGIKLKEGYRILIMGRANVGKSTLFNRLIGYDRSIIHEEPGTTRDYIEDSVELSGIFMRLYDTAGLLNKPLGPDQTAQERTIDLIEHADLILLLFDGAEPMNEQDIYLYDLTKNRSTLFVVNKVDLNVRLNEQQILSDCIKLSAKTGKNCDVLIKRIKEKCVPNIVSSQPLITRMRHVQAFERLKDCLNNARNAQTPDIMAFELNAALEAVGELTGKVLSKDILDRIFEEFCIGK
jgi:tRNA modification GTPase